MKKILSLVICLMFLMTSGIANAITLAERDELNNATPGTSKVGLGTLIRSMNPVGTVTHSTGDTSITLSSEPGGDVGYVRKLTGAASGDSTALGAGSPGQVITFALVNDGGQNYTITPDTSSGFDDVTLDDAGDNVTLKFINTTIGWILVGESGVTVSAPVNPFN